MSILTDKVGKAALQVLDESGEFSPEQREAIAKSVVAGVQAFADRLAEIRRPHLGEADQQTPQ